MKKIIWIIIILAALAVIVWALSRSKQSIVSTNVPLKVGAVLALSGPGAGVGEIVRNGYQFKADELNAGGFPIQLDIEDSGTDQKKAIAAFNLLTDVKKDIVVFTIISSDSMALKPLVEERKNAILWANATHPDLTNNTEFILRHSSTASGGADVISDSLMKDGRKKVAIVYQQDEWGVVFNKLLTDILTQQGVIVSSEAIDNKSADFKSQITKLKSQNPDAFVYGVFGSAAGVVIKQTKELGYTGAMYAGVGFGLTPDAQKIAGDSAQGLKYQKYVLNPQFSTDYKAKYGNDVSPLGYVAYTDLELLVDAVKKTGSRDPQTLIQYIKNLGTFEGKYEKVKIQPNGDIVLPTTIEIWN